MNYFSNYRILWSSLRILVTSFILTSYEFFYSIHKKFNSSEHNLSLLNIYL
jgi:hypothetical protein